MKGILSASVGVVALALISAAAPAESATPTYTQVKAVGVGAPDRWDYLTFDPSTDRLYLSHGDRVDVLDGNTGAVLGSVKGMPGGTHGIGIVDVLGKGYTDDGGAGQAAAFDLKTFKVLSRIKAEDDADGIVVDPKSGHVFVIDGDSADLTVIDPKTDKVVATVKGGGGLEFGVADGVGHVFVDGAEKKEMLRIDTATNTVDAHWPMPKCESPHGLAMDTQSRRLFVSCVNKVLTVVNADTGAVVATLPIGAGTDGAAFDPKRKLIFSANGVDGTISVIREDTPDRFTPLGDIKTAVTARTLTINPATGRLYVAVAAIDPAATVPPGPNGRPGRPRPIPGSLKVLFLDPQI
jgi:YVTN family beta-propeller protein